MVIICICLPMFDQSVGQCKLLGAVLAPKHLLVELLHVHPVHAVALERQVTSEQRYYKLKK